MSGIRVRAGVVAGLVVSLLMLGLAGVVSVPQASAADGPVVSLGDASGLERDSVNGSVFVPVFLSAPAVAPVTVSFFTASGSATSGVDYSRWGSPSNPKSVTIPAGSLQGAINVPVLNDNLTEDDESFSVVAGSVSGGGATIGVDTGRATIVDADGVSGDNPAITVSSGTVIEGDSGLRRAQVHVHLSRAPISPVTMTYQSLDGTAVAPGDYTAKLPGTVVFAPGQISKTIDVSVNSNTTVDLERTLIVLVEVTGGSPVEELNMAGLSAIVNDDATLPADAVAITAGNNHSCALLADGAIRCWGNNGFGQLGNGAVGISNVPVPVSGIVGATSITAGYYHSCAVLAGGSVSCWGDNSVGQLGNGTNVGSIVPAHVTGMADAVAIDGGEFHSCALLAGGTVSCWGDNSFGQLGSGTNVNSSVPVPVTGIVGAVGITAGGDHSCALLAGGSVSCWGWNGLGQLGNGTTTNSTLPVPVSGIADATAVSVNGDHSCALSAGGSVSCWGWNGLGQLGNGSTTNSTLPVPVTGIVDATSIAASRQHTCATLADASGVCWGYDGSGGLGDGGVNSASNVPVAVAGMTNATAVAGGGAHSCALLDDGAVSCWGWGDAGQLGDGTGTDSPVPVSVVGLGATP